jgi:hypothetical protein
MVYKKEGKVFVFKIGKFGESKCSEAIGGGWFSFLADRD